MGVKHFDGKVDTAYIQESAKRVEKVKLTSYKMMELKQGMKEEALDKNIATDVEMKCWNEESSRKTENGKFFGLVNMILISGRKPKFAGA